MPANITGTLNTSKSVVLDASGNGQVEFKTYNGNQSWTVQTVTVSTGSLVAPFPSATLYLGTPMSKSNQFGSTWTGSRNTAHANLTVGPCDQVFVVWEGGNPGDTATALLYGTSTTRRG